MLCVSGMDHLTYFITGNSYFKIFHLFNSFIHIIIFTILLTSQVQKPCVIYLSSLQSKQKKEGLMFTLGLCKHISPINYHLEFEETKVQKGFTTCKPRSELITPFWIIPKHMFFLSLCST